MEILNNNNIIKDIYCQFHPHYKIEQIQVSGFYNNKQNQSLFYCSECVEKDYNFKLSNYLPFQKISSPLSNEIITQWPPNSDARIINKLSELLNKSDNSTPFEEQIIAYFTKFKAEIMYAIDNQQIQMIKKVQELNKKNFLILDQYNEFSKLNQLKSIFVDNRTNFHQKQMQFKELIDHLEQSSNQIMFKLNYILNSINEKFNINKPQSIKQTILNSFNNIDFFESIQQYIPNNQLISQFIEFNLFDGKISDNSLKYNKDNINSIEVFQQNNSLYQSFISNFVLDKNEKYIFRIKIQPSKQNKDCIISLSYQSESDYKSRYANFGFAYEKNQISLNKIYYKYFKFIKGKEFKLTANNQMEMRVNLKDGIVEYLDYPHYNYHITMDDNYNDYTKQNNQRLSLIFAHSNFKIVLQEAFTVQSFN